MTEEKFNQAGKVLARIKFIEELKDIMNEARPMKAKMIDVLSKLDSKDQDRLIEAAIFTEFQSVLNASLNDVKIAFESL